MDKKKSSSLLKFSVSDRDFLNKKIQANSKYASVKSRTNTGLNISKRQELERELKKYYKIKNNEVFRRISLVELLQLMAAYAEEFCFFGNEEVQIKSSNSENKANESPKDTVTLLVHEMDELVIPSEPKKNVCPFLLVDVRSRLEFSKGHLATAICHPHSRLARAVGWECQEMILYKNHSDWVIIIYDECEDLCAEVAETLINRGYENIFVLSGGFRLAYDKIGSPFITTDTTKQLSATLSDFLHERVSKILIPPTTMGEASGWSNAKSSDSGNSGSNDSGFEQNGVHYSWRERIKKQKS